MLRFKTVESRLNGGKPCFCHKIAVRRYRARNPIFETLGSTIQSTVRIWYPKTYYIPETKGRTIAEHRAIADGVAAGDMDAAGQAMRAHLVAAAQRLRTLLPSRET